MRWILRFAFVATAAWGAWHWLHGPSVDDGSWLVVDIGGGYRESGPAGLVDRVLGRGPSLDDLLTTLRKARHDGRVAGVIARIDTLDGGWAQAEEIRQALALVKARGKRVVAELEVELAPASREVHVASAADTVYVAPAAAPLLVGASAKAVFLGGVWPRIDVGMQVEQIGAYKSAGDQMARESMTPAHREMLDSLLEDTQRAFVKGVAESRNVSADGLDAAIEKGLVRPADFVAAGIANAVRAHEQVLADAGGGKAPPLVSAETYSQVTLRALGLGDGPEVAVVHASGTVNTGESRPGSSAFGSRTVAESLREAAADDDVKAIVLRIASPGGSPAAADEVWTAVRDAAARKPVVASLGDVAASGGYWIASAATRIVSAPGTLTGSIGVVFFKPDVGTLLGRAGIRTETLARGRYSRLLDLDKPLDDAELAVVKSQIADVYELFLTRVAEGRGRKRDDIDRVGGGRVWTGRQAFERGLVDELGTFDDAVRAAANAAGIHDSDQVKLVHWPRRTGLAATLAETGAQVGASMQPVLLTRLAETLGDLGPLLELEPGVHALAPSVPDLR